jgi:hypothetical protein
MGNWIVAVVILSGGVLAMPANASQSHAMYLQCKTIPNYRPGDLWRDDAAVDARMKGFLPESGAPSLRMLALVSEKSTISLLTQEIRSICQDYRAGKLEEYLADQWLSNAENAIRKFQDELAKEAIDQSKGGDVAKIPSIRLLLTDLAVLSRQDALLGESDLADAAWQTMIEIFEVFYEAFTTTCMNQSFDDGIALAIERQAQIIGMGGDSGDYHCANRREEAKWALGGNAYTWKSCGGLTVGKWKVAATGQFVGDGTGVIESDGNGDYTAHFSTFGKFRADLKETGTLNFHCLENEFCDCLRHPGKEECAGVDTSKVQWVLSVRGEDFNGTIYFPAPLGPRGVPEEDDDRKHGVLWQDYPVKRINVDKPCTPDDDSSKN